MILVDSSVWIEAWRGKNAIVVEALSDLIERQQAGLNSLIQTEILQGAKDSRHQRQLKRLLEPVPQLDFPKDFWEEAPKQYLQYRKKGLTLSTMDNLIACHARLAAIPLWSLDKIFSQLPQLKTVKI